MSKPSSAGQAGVLPLPRVRTRCVALDPHIWGYADRAEMEAAFAGSEGSAWPRGTARGEATFANS
jgi:hypothetical protein